MGLLPTWAEISLRRVKWPKDMSGNMDRHRQAVVALLGTSRCDLAPPLDGEGRIHDYIHPWLHLFVEALGVLDHTEEGQLLLENVDGRFGKIFEEGDINHDFLEIDCDKARAALLSAALAPARWCEQDEGAAGRSNDS